MNAILLRIKKSYLQELPIIRIYAVLYLIGVFIGVAAAILLRDDFTFQVQFLFDSENGSGFFSAYLQLLFWGIFFVTLLRVFPFLCLNYCVDAVSMGHLTANWFAIHIVFYLCFLF